MPGPKDGPTDIPAQVKADNAYTEFDKALLSGKNLNAADAVRDFIHDEMLAGKTLVQAEQDFQDRLKNDKSIQSQLPELHIDFDNDSSTTYKATISMHDSFSATDIATGADVTKTNKDWASSTVTVKGMGVVSMEGEVSNSGLHN